MPSAVQGGSDVAVVLGATTALGSAIADRLRREGLAVVGLDARGADPSTRAPAGDADPSPPPFGAAAERPISVLVTAAGRDVSTPFGELGDGAWRDVLDGHLRAPADACRAVLPGMIDAGRGAVIILASAAAVETGRPVGSYAAAAAGTVLGFARSLAVEVAPHGVRLNCVLVAAETPAADIAETVAFLVRDGDFYVGQVFTPRGTRKDVA